MQSRPLTANPLERQGETALYGCLLFKKTRTTSKLNIFSNSQFNHPPSIFFLRRGRPLSVLAPGRGHLGLSSSALIHLSFYPLAAANDDPDNPCYHHSVGNGVPVILIALFSPDDRKKVIVNFRWPVTHRCPAFFLFRRPIVLFSNGFAVETFYPQFMAGARHRPADISRDMRHQPCGQRRQFGRVRAGFSEPPIGAYAGRCLPSRSIPGFRVVVFWNSVMFRVVCVGGNYNGIHGDILRGF